MKFPFISTWIFQHMGMSQREYFFKKQEEETKQNKQKIYYLTSLWRMVHQNFVGSSVWVQTKQKKNGFNLY